MILILIFSGTAKIAFLHHGNQSFSDNGSYALRYGMEGYIGNSYHRIFDTHEYYNVPLDIHISGTLLQSYAFLRNDNDLINRMKGSLVDILGGFYAEHISPYVDIELNRFALYYEKIIDSSIVKKPGWQNYPTVIWIPERVWKSEAIMPYSLIDVLNQEYGKYDDNGKYIAPCIVIDDAAQWINSLSIDTRKVYKLIDQSGDYVFVVFIDSDARNNMVWNDISNPSNPLHQELVALSNDTDQQKVIIYGDDWEKAAGVAGWDFGQAGAPSNSYDHNISWIKSQNWIQPVHICEVAKWWGSDIVNGYSPGSVPEIYWNQLQYSAYSELHSWTGGTYDNWYYDFKNTIAYGCDSSIDMNSNSKRGDYEDLWKWGREKLITTGDNNISRLGWIVLTGMLYETAWHTGPGGSLVYWGKNLWNHTRYAGGFWYGSQWLSFCDTLTKVMIDSTDVDGDGLREYEIYNNKILLIFEKRGGRALWVFSSDTTSSSNLFSNWGGEGDWDDGGHWGLFHDTQGWNSYFAVYPESTGDYKGLRFVEAYSANGDSSWDLTKRFLLKMNKNYVKCKYSSGFTNWTKSMITPDAFNVINRLNPVDFLWGVSDSGWMFAGFKNKETNVKGVYMWGSGNGLTFHNLGISSAGSYMAELGGRNGNYEFYFYYGKGEPEIDTTGPGDLEGPIIYGTDFFPNISILPEDSVKVITYTMDPSGIKNVYLHWGISPNPWEDIPMQKDSNFYFAYLPPKPYGTKVEFVIHSIDSSGRESWDNNNGKNYSYTVGLIEFLMDGELERIANIISENPSMHLWAYYYEDSGELYVATEAAGDGNDAFNNDHFIFISSSVDTLVPAPWAKTGSVFNFDAYLADENDNNYSSWYDSNTVVLSFPHATGSVLEGVFRLKDFYGIIPEKIYLAVGTYETNDGGTLQWQIPRPSSYDGNIDLNEVVQLSLTGINEERKNFIKGNVFYKRIKLIPNFTGYADIHIYDISGRKVFSRKIFLKKNEIFYIDEGLKPGFYFISFNGKGNEKILLLR